MPLRRLHRTSAIVIAVFALFHIANHLASLGGVETHIEFMRVARLIYRQPVVEGLLLFCVAFQVLSGGWLFLRGLRARRGFVPWLQAASGACLALFLLIHVSAVLFGRTALELDTNFYFAAAGFHVPPNQFFFAPYYFLAVLALFTHVGCAAYWGVPEDSGTTRRLALGVPIALGTAISLVIVLSLAGRLQPVEVPAEYKATYLP